MLIPSAVTIWSSLLTLGCFLFVAQQLSFLAWLHWSLGNAPFYAVLPLIGVGLGWTVLRQQPGADQRKHLRSLLIAGLPPILVLGAGLSLSREFHYLVFLSVGLYVIAAFGYWAWSFTQTLWVRPDQPAAPSILMPLSWRHAETRQSIRVVTLLTLLFLGFGLHDLTRFAAVDEPLWLDGRIGKFWKNLADEKMDKTLISDKPGITVVLATGPGLLAVEPSHYRDTRSDFQAKNSELNIEHYYLAFRLPLLLVITALLPLFYLLLVPLVGRLPALFAYAGISLAPVTIGMSQIVNPDSLLWVFAPLSVLAFIVFLEKHLVRYLILSGILLGLALLTKYVANFLIVYCFALVFLYPAWRGDTTPKLRALLIAFLIWIGIGLSVLYLFLPAFWIRPSELLESTALSQAFEKVAFIFIGLIGFIVLDHAAWRHRASDWLFRSLSRLRSKGIRVIVGVFLALSAAVLINGALGMPWLNFMEILASPKNSYEAYHPLALYLTHFYPLLFGTAPLLLAGTACMGLSLWRTATTKTDPASRLSLAVFGFILLYYLGSSVNDVALINRYQIALYPLLALVGGLGVAHMSTWLAGMWQEHLQPRWPQPIISGGILAITLVFLAATPLSTPFPLSYASSLLPTAYTVDVKDMGAGSYEAAMYLNQLPEAKSLTIWTDKAGVCKFFVGRCLDGLTFEKLKHYSIDYVVLSTGRAARTERMFDSNKHLLNDEGLIRFDELYHDGRAIHTIYINGRESQTVRIVPLKSATTPSI